MRQRFDDAQIAGFGRGIVHLGELPLLTIDRADDDHAAKLAFPHTGPDGVHGVENAGQVGADHLVPLLGGHFVERRVAGDACVGHHDINGAKVGFDLRDARFALVIVGNVPFVGLDAGFIGEFCRGFVVARIGRGHAITCIFQRLRNGRANSARSSGNKCNSGHGSLLLMGFILSLRVSANGVHAFIALYMTRVCHCDYCIKFGGIRQVL